MRKPNKVKQVTTVATDILVCLMEDGSLYSTKLKGRGKNKWIGIKVPNTEMKKYV